MLKFFRELLDRQNRTKFQTQQEVLALNMKYKAVFGTPDGQLVLANICKNGLVFDSTFVKGDPHETALNEGSRRLALSILRFVDKDQNEIIKSHETIA